MTDRELLECLKERPCEACKFHSDKGCSKWDCVFDSKEQESSSDAISRQATIEAFQMFRGYEANRTNAEWVDRIETVVKKLPPVNPQPKIGHWIEKYTEDGCGELYSYWACSECGRSVGFNLANIEDVLSDYPYCHCGAKMVEPQESEET